MPNINLFVYTGDRTILEGTRSLGTLKACILKTSTEPGLNNLCTMDGKLRGSDTQ